MNNIWSKFRKCLQIFRTIPIFEIIRVNITLLNLLKNICNFDYEKKL